MDEQETYLIVRAIALGLRGGGADSEHKDMAGAFRLLRTVIFDCFKSEYKPGVAILLEYLRSSGNSPMQLGAAVGVLGDHRKAEIIKCAQRLLSLECKYDNYMNQFLYNELLLACFENARLRTSGQQFIITNPLLCNYRVYSTGEPYSSENTTISSGMGWSPIEGSSG